MRCSVCGRESDNPEANFCYYCGSSFRESAKEDFVGMKRDDSYKSMVNYTMGDNSDDPYGIPNEHAGVRNDYGYRPGEPEKKGVTMFEVFLPIILLFVPAGLFIALGLSIYWIVAENSTESRRKYGKCVLIVLIVLFLFVGYLLMQMQKSGALEEYLQQYLQ